MKTLDEVIDAMERCSKPHYFDCTGCPYEDDDAEVGCRSDDRDADALHYLREYRKQKYIWKKLYLLAHQMFWGLEEEYPLDGKRIANDLFDAYSEGFEDEDAR